MRPTSTIFIAIGLVAMTGLLLLRALSPGSALEISPAAYASAEARFAGMIGGQSDQPPGGFESHRVDNPFPGIRVLEPDQLCRGGGAYLLRTTIAPRPLLISAPHRGSDRLTGPLALRLFLEGDAAAAAWNTVPRRATGECRPGRSDLARLKSHPFTAFSAAFAKAHPNGRVIQLHGFDPERRSSLEGRAAAIILSSGASAPTVSVRDLAACLRQLMPEEQVAVYPTDVRELGALRNAQGDRLRAIGFSGFIHIELSLAMRERLLDDAALFTGFRICLEAGL